MSSELLKKIIELDHFIIEKETYVDNTKVYIRPLYIETLSLYPTIIRDIAKEISQQLACFSPRLLFAVESSILPVASIVSQNLDIPLSVIRKPRNFSHEVDEPAYYLSDEMKTLSAVLIDDAIWSGYTMHYVFDLFTREGVQWPNCYYVFDFLNFNDGGRFLETQEMDHLKNRHSWCDYREIVEYAYRRGKITENAYQNTVQLFDH